MKIEDVDLNTQGFKFDGKLWVALNKDGTQVEIYNILSGDSKWIMYGTDVAPVRTILS